MEAYSTLNIISNDFIGKMCYELYVQYLKAISSIKESRTENPFALSYDLSKYSVIIYT